MAKKKYRQREVMWRVLRKHGAMTCMEMCDHINDTNNKYGVSLIPSTIAGLMGSSHLFVKHDKMIVQYLGRQTASRIVWRARSIDELVVIFTDPRRRQFGLPKLPSLIRSKVESKLEELL